MKGHVCSACGARFATLRAFDVHFPSQRGGRCEPMDRHRREGLWRPPWSRRRLVLDRTVEPPVWRLQTREKGSQG